MAITDDLERLVAMHASGALTDDEFKAAKSRILMGPTTPTVATAEPQGDQTPAVDLAADHGPSTGEGTQTAIHHKARCQLCNKLVALNKDGQFNDHVAGTGRDLCAGSGGMRRARPTAARAPVTTGAAPDGLTAGPFSAEARSLLEVIRTIDAGGGLTMSTVISRSGLSGPAARVRVDELLRAGWLEQRSGGRYSVAVENDHADASDGPAQDASTEHLQPSGGGRSPEAAAADDKERVLHAVRANAPAPVGLSAIISHSHLEKSAVDAAVRELVDDSQLWEYRDQRYSLPWKQQQQPVGERPTGPDHRTTASTQQPPRTVGHGSTAAKEDEPVDRRILVYIAAGIIGLVIMALVVGGRGDGPAPAPDPAGTRVEDQAESCRAWRITYGQRYDGGSWQQYQTGEECTQYGEPCASWRVEYAQRFESGQWVKYPTYRRCA